MLPIRRRRRNLMAPTPPMQSFFDLMRPWMEEEPWEETGAYPMDVREEDGKIIVDAEMPGFKQDEIDVSLDRGTLRIVAERKPEEAKGNRYMNERRYTRVERAVTLPSLVDESKAEARLENGVLHMELPQSEEGKPRQIEVH